MYESHPGLTRCPAPQGLSACVPTSLPRHRLSWAVTPGFALVQLRGWEEGGEQRRLGTHSQGAGLQPAPGSAGRLLGHAGVERALLPSAGGQWWGAECGGLRGHVSSRSSSEHPGTVGQEVESVGSPWVSRALWVRTTAKLGGTGVGTKVLTHLKRQAGCHSDQERRHTQLPLSSRRAGTIGLCGWDELAGATHTSAAQTRCAVTPGSVLWLTCS